MPASLVCVLVAGVFVLDASAETPFDVGLMLGSTRATDAGPVLRFDRGTTYQATFAWWVWRNDAVGVAAEVPFLASPAFTVIPPNAALPLEYASLYLTPGVRVAAFPHAAVSMFGTVGAGYARYSESKLTGNRSPNPDVTPTPARLRSAPASTSAG